MDKIVRRAGCYVRVSTENQLENYSIEEQTERLKSYCKAKDWTIARIYTDGGYSGGNMDRPALKEMLNDIHNGSIDIVVVYKLDRLSRSQKDTLTLIEDEFIINNVDFVSMSENFDTSTPFGRAMIGILSVFAQLEKDQITERFTMGRIGRAKNGYYHGGPTAPTGYDYTDGELVVNEYEAMQIREVFDRFINGQSINSIRKHMSENYTNKYGNWSSHALVLNILRNDIYIGMVKFKGVSYPGRHEPIITKDTFEMAQQLLTSEEREDSKTIYQKTPFKANNLLSSIIYCKHCGARFSGNHGNYVCYSRGKTNKRQIKDPNCKNKRWDIQKLDNIITDEILKLAFDEDYINELAKKSESKEVKVDVSKVSERIENIDKQIAKLIDLYQVSGISIEQISDRIAKLKQEKDAISEKLANDKNLKLTIPRAKELLSKANQIFNTGDMAKKRLLVSSLIDYIEIDNNKLDIHWSFI